MTTINTEAAQEYQAQAWDFLERSKEYLQQGDWHQACEKAWGTSSHMAKAVAAVQGLEYNHHGQFHRVMDHAESITGNEQLRSWANSANTLHSSYYERKSMLNARLIRLNIGDVESLLHALQPLAAADI